MILGATQLRTRMCGRSSLAAGLVLLVQSPVEPSWTSLPPGFLLGLDDGLANPAVKSMGDLLAVLCERMQLAFRLRANATRRIDTKTQADGKRRHGKRVPVRGEEGRLAWLLRQGAANGFELQRTENGQYDIVTREEPRSIGVRQGKRITFSGVRYDGTLTITDALRFRGAVEAGIGPGKAYGFGLLSLKRL